MVPRNRSQGSLSNIRLYRRASGCRCGVLWQWTCVRRQGTTWVQPLHESHERRTPGEGGCPGGQQRRGAEQRLVLGTPQRKLLGRRSSQFPCILSGRGQQGSWWVPCVCSQGKLWRFQRQVQVWRGHGWQVGEGNQPVAVIFQEG